jgi:glycosyltransferase involved in cell wall biosynthesis
MDRTSVFIFPSLWPETLGIVGVEALSRGVPVVASDVGGVREWCHDGETGYVVPPKDAAAIADRVQRLIGDDQILKTFGKRGLELIRNRFLPHQHVNQLVSWYQNAVSAAPASEGINV